MDGEQEVCCMVCGNKVKVSKAFKLLSDPDQYICSLACLGSED